MNSRALPLSLVAAILGTYTVLSVIPAMYLS